MGGQITPVSRGLGKARDVALAVVFQEVVHSDLIEEAEAAKSSDSRENRMDTHKRMRH
jgi:hypothetical protein